MIQLLVASFLFGFLGIFGKIGFLNGLSIGEILTYRFTLASIFLWFYFLFFKKDEIALSKNQTILSILLGLFGYALFSTLYFTSIKGVSVAVASLLLFTYPFFVAIGTHFIHKERLTKFEWSNLGVATFGLILLISGEFRVDSLISLVCGLLSGIIYAIYILVSAKYQRAVKPLSSNLYIISASAVGLFLIHRPEISKIATFTLTHWFVIIGLAFFCTILSLTLILSGLQKVSAKKAVIFTMLEPITASIMGYFIFGESLTRIQIVGALLILIAIFLTKKRATEVAL